MLSAQKLRSEVNRLLAEIKAEHKAVECDITHFPSDTGRITFLMFGMDHMHTLQVQLRELVGDAASAMIARELSACPDRKEEPATPSSTPSDLLNMTYSPELLLESHLDVSITGDAEFLGACEWGFTSFLEEVESGYYGHYTENKVREWVRTGMVEVYPFVGQVPLVFRVGVVLGWLSALALVQRDEALAGLNELLSLVNQL